MRIYEKQLQYSVFRTISCLRKEHVFFKFLNALIFINLITILISFLFDGESKAYFGWLVLYIPAVWFAWLVYAIIFINYTLIIKLTYQWFLINISSLLFFISFSMGILQWEKSNGADLVVYISYFPVIYPISRYVYLVPNKFNYILNTFSESLVSVFPNSKQGIITVWLYITSLAIFQCLIIVFSAIVIKVLFYKIRKHSEKQKE